MARTFAQIQAQILAEKAATPELAALNSTSQTAVWLLWVNVTARVLVVMEQLWDLALVVLERRAAELQVGTSKWYVAKSKEFEVGNTSLAFDIATHQVKYAISVPANRIVAFAAIAGSGAVSVLKVAKDDGSGQPTPLSSGELGEFNAYLDRFKFAGAQITSQSIAADVLKLIGKIYYDGAYSQAVVKAAVELAITDFLKTLPFNGVLYRNKLVDIIQAVAGVIDVDVDTLEGKSIATSSYNNIDRAYASLSGYIKVDSGFPLNTSLTYFAE